MGVDTVTRGAPSASQINGTEGLILDTVNNVLYTFGQTHQATPVLSAAKPLALTGQTTATTATAGAATALPATPAGYLTTTVNGTTVKIPYYAV